MIDQLNARAISETTRTLKTIHIIDSHICSNTGRYKDDDYHGQMIFGDLVGLKLPDICLTGEKKPQKNLAEETCPDRGSKPGPLLDRRTCYGLLHSGGQKVSLTFKNAHFN